MNLSAEQQAMLGSAGGEYLARCMRWLHTP